MSRVCARAATRVALAAAICGAAALADLQGQEPADLFDGAGLHEVRLYMHSGDVERLRERYLENRFYAADLEWKGTRVRNIAVRSRGGGSRNPVKVGLAVEFDRYVTGQTFAGRRSLVLDNLWQDASMVRERVAMALFARMGQPAPLESFTRLYLNGEYQGIYSIVESIDPEFLARTAADPAGDLHEYHWVRPYYFEPLDREVEAYEPLFEPRTRTRAAASEIYGPLEDMIDAVNTDDTAWRDAVEPHVDLAQIVTHVAVASFMSEWDGFLGYAGVNNFYLYRPSGRTQHQIIPWDRDHAFRDEDPSILRRAAENVLIRRALTYPDLYARYLDVLEETARVAAEQGWLEDQIRAAASVVTAAMEDDPRRPYTVEQHLNDVQALIEFARQRPHDVLRQVAEARQ